MLQGLRIRLPGLARPAAAFQEGGPGGMGTLVTVGSVGAANSPLSNKASMRRMPASGPKAMPSATAAFKSTTGDGAQRRRTW